MLLPDTSYFSFKPSHTKSLFDSLPNELISLILERGYFDGTPQPNTSFRSSMVRTSHRFHQISLHTPSLWSIIKFTPKHSLIQAAHLITTYLTRSMDYPLSIELTYLTHHMANLILGELIPQSKRWKSLTITTSGDHIFSLIQHIPVPHLEYLNISYFATPRRISLPSPFMADSIPKLSFLYLRNVDLDTVNFPLINVKTLDIRGYGRWPGHPQLTTMLEGSQSLEQLILHVKAGLVLREIELIHHNQSQILLPSLRNLVVYTSEWLTDRINILIRLFACPKLRTLVVSESTTFDTIINYDVEAGPLLNSPSCSSSPSSPRLLVVRSADIYLSCLSVPSSTLTTLELHKVIWPSYVLLKEAFGALRQLQHLLILSLNPGDAFVHITNDLTEPRLAEVDSSILVSSLRTLTIEFGQTSEVCGCGCLDHALHAVPFLRLFSLPQLTSLNLRHLNSDCWKSIVNSFACRVPEYPTLTSLTLSDMTLTNDITLPKPGDYRDAVEAFPFLQRLSLNRIHSNGFIQYLLPPSPLPNDLTPTPLCWPSLRTLSLSGDANVSKPLLGRVITTREGLGVPFGKLYLDHHLTTNIEFWDWVMDKVDVELITDDQANWWFHSP